MLVARNGDQRGLVDPLGAEDVKRTGVENLAGDSTPMPPPSILTLQVSQTLHMHTRCIQGGSKSKL